MRGRAIVGLFVAAVFAFAVCGCGNGGAGASASSSASADETYADVQFIADLGKALEARWAITDDPETNPTTISEEKEVYGKAVQAELDLLEGYTEGKFHDSTLQAKAIQYINCLKDQQKSLEYAGVDYDKYQKDWGKAYNERTKLVKEFVDDYGLTVSEEKASVLEDLTLNASLVNEQESKQKAVEEICKSMEFKADESDEYGGKYVAVVKNTSDIDFKTFGIRINLLDKDDVIIESTYSSVDNWDKGQKARFDFYYSTEEPPFEKVSVKSDYWDEAK